MKLLNLLILCILLIPGTMLRGQEGSYFAVGWYGDKMLNQKPLQTIVDDFNEHFSGNGYTLNRPLEVRSTIHGLFLGLKYDNEILTMGIDLHGHSGRSTAMITEGLNQPYEKQLRVSHSGFAMGFGMNIIHAEGFHMGPVFNLAFEQFRVITTGSSKLIDPNQDILVDAFYLSTIWKFPISIGGEEFTFDLIPYFQLPFYRINLEGLNENLNAGFAKPYTKDEMKMRVMSYGLIVTLNFRMKGR